MKIICRGDVAYDEGTDDTIRVNVGLVGVVRLCGMLGQETFVRLGWNAGHQKCDCQDGCLPQHLTSIEHMACLSQHLAPLSQHLAPLSQQYHHPGHYQPR